MMSRFEKEATICVRGVKFETNSSEIFPLNKKNCPRLSAISSRIHAVDEPVAEVAATPGRSRRKNR